LKTSEIDISLLIRGGKFAKNPSNSTGSFQANTGIRYCLAAKSEGNLLKNKENCKFGGQSDPMHESMQQSMDLFRDFWQGISQDRVALRNRIACR
jgi:hypothetical protein